LLVIFLRTTGERGSSSFALNEFRDGEPVASFDHDKRIQPECFEEMNHDGLSLGRSAGTPAAAGHSETFTGLGSAPD
jgi:hypothetical protein